MTRHHVHLLRRPCRFPGPLPRVRRSAAFPRRPAARRPNRLRQSPFRPPPLPRALRRHPPPGIVELFLLYRGSEVTAALEIGAMERQRAMLDPVLHHLQQAKQTAIWVAQLMRVDPELMLPAALPLLAARPMVAGGGGDDSAGGES